jgi:hypothetical protein
MKRITAITTIALLMLAGCGSGGKQTTDDVITVDVTKSYPKKELILQDFMDVEYIALDDADEFVTQGMVRAIGKEIILVRNRINDGDIFIFNRKTGKGLRKINRKGQGGEEYSNLTEIVLDENKNEIFVIAYSARKILVYDLFGNFKRSFPFADSGYYTYTFNFDAENLICYKSYSTTNLSDNLQPCHLIISKQDGSINRTIQIPFKNVKTPIFVMGEVTISPLYHRTIPYHGNWALAEASSDTVYNYVSDDNLTTPLIARTPSIHSMDIEVFLYPSVFTDRYYFMKTLKKEFDLARMKGFPSTDLMYDKQENAIFEYTVYNGDYTDNRRVDLSSNPVNHEIAICESLEAYQLVEDYKKGLLKGKLKEIAATLDEESNPVIMLAKHRKQ